MSSGLSCYADDDIVRYAETHKLAVVMPNDYNANYQDMDGDDVLSVKYFTFLVEEPPKVCRALFPLSDKREDNFAAGLSMGAYGSFKCAMIRPDLRSAGICT